jgi:hypothetical protein
MHTVSSERVWEFCSFLRCNDVIHPLKGPFILTYETPPGTFSFLIPVMLEWVQT